MQLSAQFNDGRTPRSETVAVTVEADRLIIARGAGPVAWPIADLRRADDDVGDILLRLEPDTGERLHIAADDRDALKTAAPHLFHRRATGRAGIGVAAGLAAAAAVIALLFFVLLPVAAGPLARNAPSAYDDRIGDLAWMQAQTFGDECVAPDDLAAVEALNRVSERLSTAAGLEEPVKIILMDAGFPNAFALPGGVIIFTDDLIQMADHPDEIAGVLAHEMAHVKERHALANVIRQMSFGVLIDVVMGGGGFGQQLASLMLNVAALSYSRDVESEADALAIRYLDAAGYDPGGVARFFDLLNKEEERGLVIPELISTHPDTKARADAVRGAAKPGRPPALDAAEWRAVKSACGMSYAADPDGAPSATPTP